MKIAKVFISVILFSAGLVVGVRLGASSPTAKADVKNLMQMPLAHEFTPGREVRIDLVQIPPDAALERHWHPGEEFHCYLGIQSVSDQVFLGMQNTQFMTISPEFLKFRLQRFGRSGFNNLSIPYYKPSNLLIYCPRGTSIMTQ